MAILGGIILVVAVLVALAVLVNCSRGTQAGHAGAKLVSQGNYSAAIPLLLRAVTTRADDARSHYLLGLAYARIGWHRAAINQLSTAVRLDPQSAEFHEALGCVHRDAGNRAAAVRELDEAVRLTPVEVRHHVRLAELLIEMGERTEAIAHMQEAARLRPSSMEIRFLLTRVLSAPASPAEVTDRDREDWRLAADTALASEEVRADGCRQLTETPPAPLSR